MGIKPLAYYNEIDPYAAQWLRNLIAAGHIAPGDVDERSIVDVRADDVRGYTQCHWFAGIGGWSVALRLAGWPDDRPVWTGSCPCQPFSSAGAGKAADDSRHLWPAWFSLIAECRPAVVFGEQVEAAIGWGWIDAVFADLESQSYSCGAAVLPACSVGAPHIRQRLWFVADSDGRHSSPEGLQRGGEHGQWAEDGGVGELADSDGLRSGWRAQAERRQTRDGDARGARRLGDPVSPRLQEQRGLGILPSGESRADAREAAERTGASVGLLADAVGSMADAERNGGRTNEPRRQTQGRDVDGRVGFWAACDWHPCTDGKARPVEPGSFPLAHGVQRRASKLRAYGNAVVPQTAESFIRAFL